mmetsp:Transcript_24811/g.51566  ORF Transcript_24811/g.51566 Transcript_24811/m.51566 type:complete len:219 (-) Transcript_24811:179-835(-)
MHQVQDEATLITQEPDTAVEGAAELLHEGQVLSKALVGIGMVRCDLSQVYEGKAVAVDAARNILLTNFRKLWGILPRVELAPICVQQVQLVCCLGINEAATEVPHIEVVPSAQGQRDQVLPEQMADHHFEVLWCIHIVVVKVDDDSPRRQVHADVALHARGQLAAELHQDQLRVLLLQLREERGGRRLVRLHDDQFLVHPALSLEHFPEAFVEGHATI